MRDYVPSRVAIIGHGRFGRALADLSEEAGLAVSALDPGAPVPQPRRAASVAALVDGADAVFLAVPVPATRAVVLGLRPHLDRRHLVVDVASVKHGPVHALTEVLGADVPWVATHPLFGPSSIALGERPLRAVVCPNALHPDAAARGRALYERLGCHVHEQGADEHDRAMARTHALAFFVAKGLMDIGATENPRFAPPSFLAMARTIAAVRSDAGHLFRTIQQDNPHASDARQDLLDALIRAHEHLDGSSDESAPELRIPDLGPQAPELREARDLIDECDQELIRLLARRGQLARRAGRAKAARGRPIRDPAREGDLLAARREWGVAADLDADGVTDIFRAVLRASRALQKGD